VGVPARAQREFFGDAEAGRLFDESLAHLAALGAEVVEIDFSAFREAAALLYQGPWVAERWAALRDFHAKHADAFFPVTRQIVEGAAKLGAADAFDGFHQLAALARRTEAEWEKMDVLLVPTAPRPYTLAEVAAEPLLLNSRLGTYTNFVNLLDLSALAVPAGFRADGVPWGVTFIAPAWHEHRLLEIGSRWHESVGGKQGATTALLPARAALPASPPAAGSVRLAVVGAHLSGLPLNHQLTDRGARRVWSGDTAPQYRFFALPGTTPPKPGLVRVASGGAAIAVEVWEMSTAAFGSFVAAIPPPLGVGTIALASGESVKGFLCESVATVGATDITRFGGWRAFLAGR
jgi:allophanate hydrolase